MKGKIFGIGLQRSGTTSLAHALISLGFKTCHYVTHLDEMEKADAIVDAPVFADYQRLDIQYPDSKFICTVRDLNKWAKSFKEKVVDKHIRDNTQPRTMNLRCNRDVFGTLERAKLSDLSFLIKKHNDHVEQAKAYFSNRPGDFLLLKIDEDPKLVQTSLRQFLNVAGNEAHFPFDANPTTHGWESFQHPLKVRIKK